MAAIVISQLTQALSFLREHPNLACVLLLLLSSPIYRILLYFTPLLLSTALCIFALITLTPYVTATDAEVERQSMLGASSQKFKKKTITSATTSISNERKREDVSGYGHASSSSSASSASSSLPSSSPSSSAAETSWISWMKGLNDIGRTWMENKLTEQGLALSEPANRETLLAFIEGSFADLMTAQANPSSDQLFGAMESCEDASTAAAAELGPSMEKTGGLPKASFSSEEALALQKRVEGGEGMFPKVSSSFLGDGDGLPVEDDLKGETNSNTVSQAAVEVPWVAETDDQCLHTPKSVPESIGPSDGDAMARSRKLVQEHKLPVVHGSSLEVEDAISDTEPATIMPGTPSRIPAPSKLLEASRKTVQEHKLPVVHDSSVEVEDAISETQAAYTIMPGTPSRIPAPSKLFEVSRRFFSKEEQGKAMVSRGSISSMARSNQSVRSALGSSGPSKMESSPSLFKLPTRKFLERSKSIPNKEISKQSSSSTASGSPLPGKKVGQPRVMESSVPMQKEAFNVARREADDGIKDEILHAGDADDVVSGPSDDNGPMFDEDLEVEEAQALVQSELKMLEVELDEVAAKLPKLDGTFTYQRTTPVSSIKSAPASITPAGTPTKCATALFSASPALKT